MDSQSTMLILLAIEMNWPMKKPRRSGAVDGYRRQGGVAILFVWRHVPVEREQAVTVGTVVGLYTPPIESDKTRILAPFGRAFPWPPGRRGICLVPSLLRDQLFRPLDALGGF